MAPDGLYGEQDELGNFNGLIGELVNRKADIGLGAISVMNERESVIDFTVPFYNPMGISVLMKKTEVIKIFFYWQGRLITNCPHIPTTRILVALSALFLGPGARPKTCPRSFIYRDRNNFFHFFYLFPCL